MKVYDAVVIGAGPAGSSLAYQLKMKKLSVLLIDKASFPRDKLCGGLCPDKTAKIYEKIYQRPFDCFDTKCEKLRIVNNLKTVAEAHPTLPLYLVARRDFDAHLLELYVNTGGEAMTGTKVSKFDRETSVLTLSDGEKIGYKVLAGADGANSSVRKLIDPKYRPNGFCVEGYGKKDPENAVTVTFGFLKKGYGWVFPQKERTVVGYGSFTDPPSELVDKFEEFSSGTGFPASDKKGAYLPVGKIVTNPCAGNILLVGDAAGFVNPITGEGIYFAFLSASLAAEAIAEYRNGAKSLSAAYLPKIRNIQKHIKKANKIKDILYSPAVLNSLCKKMSGKSEFLAYACDEIISKMPESYSKVLKNYSGNDKLFP